jgi:hypothetical protein
VAKSIYGSLLLKTQSSLIFADADSTNTVSLRAPATVGSNLTLTLPASVTASGVLSTDGSGNLSAALLVNANVSGSAAIAYSKLALTNSIVNADINSAADIALSKLVAQAPNLALVSDGVGVISTSAVTATELGYVSGVTSAIQTQLGGKASTALSNLTVSGLAAESLLVGTSSSAVESVAVGTDGQVLSVVAGAVAWADAAASVASFKTDWETADTAVFAIDHSLNSLDVKVEIYDIATGETIEVDSVVRTDVDTLTVTASEAPPAGGWRVLILAV